MLCLQGAALGLLDVLNSAVGVAAPLLGGLLLGGFGSESLAAAGAATYALIGGAVMLLLRTPDVAIGRADGTNSLKTD